jgi:hypothetical protein
MESADGHRDDPCIEVIDDDTAAYLRSLTMQERWDRADLLFEMAKNWMLAGIQSLNPDWTPEQVHNEWLRRRTLGTR